MGEIVKEMISEEDVAKKIKEMAEQINRDYEGKELRVVCILKGAVFFACELTKHLTVPVTFDFIRTSSYENGMKSKGVVTFKKALDEPLEGLDVLVIEDIADTGITLSATMDLFADEHPKSLKLAVLLDKKPCRKKEVKLDYVGFEVPDAFIVGYGLDYAQKYRNLPYIGVLEFTE